MPEPGGAPHDGRAELADAVASVQVALRELRTEMAAQREVLDRLARQVAELSAGVGLARRMEEARERLGHAVDAAISVEHSLSAHLEDRDRRLRQEREELARAFAEQLAQGVGRRDLRRFARHVEAPAVEVVPGRAADPPPAPAHAVSEPARPDDPLRQALSQVRGLGPARLAALADHFGSVEAVRRATDEDLLGVAGVTRAMLPGIRAAVG